MGFSFHNLASNSVGGTVGFWSTGEPQFGDIIYLDYGASDQFNHWVKILGSQPGLVVLNQYLLNIANRNMLEIQAQPELQSQNYYYIDIVADMGTWENGGSMLYRSFGPGSSLNSWEQIAPSPDPLEQKLMRYK